MPASRDARLHRLGTALWAGAVLISGAAVSLVAGSWIVGVIFMACVALLQADWLMRCPRRRYRRDGGADRTVLPAGDGRQALVTRVTSQPDGGRRWDED